MKMEKVKLTKKQAEALETVNHISKAEVIELHIENPDGWAHECMNGMNLDTLIRALYIGYEIEQTPEEQLLECYKNYKDNPGVRHGVKMTLNTLNIKIKGINTDDE
jgi:hypothetical protein